MLDNCLSLPTIRGSEEFCEEEEAEAGEDVVDESVVEDSERTGCL